MMTCVGSLLNIAKLLPTRWHEPSGSSSKMTSVVISPYR